MASLFADNWEILKGKNMLQTHLVSSHDSSSYSIDENAHIVSDNSYITSINKVPKLLRSCLKINKLISTFARSQTLDVISQLRCGVRVLDIRICWYENQFFTNHALLGITVLQVLNQTHQFLCENLHEFVELKFIWSDTGCKDDYSAELTNLIMSHPIAAQVIPPLSSCDSLETLKAKNNRALIIMEGKDRRLSLNNNIFANRYFQTNDPLAKIQNHQAQLSTFAQQSDASQLFDLQLILTPSSDDIKTAIFKMKLSQNNLLQLNKKWPTLSDIGPIQKTFENLNRVHSISVDFVDSSFANLAQQFINL